MAKEAFKANKEEIGFKFLDQEKSVLTKIPQYVEQKRWDKAITLTVETHDSNMMVAVLDKLLKTGDIKNFIQVVSQHKVAFQQVLDFLKTYHSEIVEMFLKENSLHEELLFLYIESYFLSTNIKERTIHLENAKASHKYLMDKDKEEWKFYTTYLNDLENSIYFKKDMINENYVKNTDTGGFDRSVFSFFSELIYNNLFGYVESKNKVWFEVSAKKINIIRLKVYAESQNLDAIKLFNSQIKPNVASYAAFAEICLQNKLNDYVVEFLKKITDEDMFEYKYTIFKHVEKYEAALELVISSKECDRQVDYVNELRSKDPSLEPKIKEFCVKYKVNLTG